MTVLLVDRLRERVTQQPEAVVVIQHDHVFTYQTLWTQANAIAAYLQQQNVRSGDRVAILFDNSIHYIAAYYGVLIAGGVAVPLNTAARANDFANQIAHCDAHWLIADGQHGAFDALLSQLPATVHVIATTASTTASKPSERVVAWQSVMQCNMPVSVAISPDQLCSIIYTSGTTGRPKGVMLSHRNLASNVQSILDYLPIRADDRMMTVLPFFYSYGNSVLHTHVAAGATLVLENQFVYPHDILKSITKHRCSSFAGVPSMYALLLNRTTMSDYDLSSLRYLTQAGGAMPTAQIERLREQLPQAPLFVMYGQTEASARLSYLPPDQLMHKLGSVGIAIPGVELSIQRDNGQRCDVGEYGEICARGDNIMLGYWGDAEQTAQVLRNGFLHTGDIAMRDADGFIFIQGRRSDMIKIGAHRVHPNEIEEVIAQLPDVADVAVVGVDDAILGQVAKAVIVIRQGSAPDVMKVKAHCRAHLAQYKIPKFIEYTHALPRTASGKLQRFLLTTEPAGGRVS